MKKVVAAFGLMASLGFVGTTLAEDSGCVIHYVRTACQGQEAVSFKKCDGAAECDKTKDADSAEACAVAALNSCDNSRLDITKYKVITAKYNGEDVVGGFDDEGNPDAAGMNFCDKNRPDLNQCE